MKNDFAQIIALIEKSGYLCETVRHQNLAEINHNGKIFDIHSFSLGSMKPTHPTFFLVGGVHGLERIGAELCLSLLKSTINRLAWDTAFRHLLESIRIVFVPLLNPVGYYHSTRSNGNGVDLMRNSPVEAEEKVPFLLGGQRYSSQLIWYRGKAGELEIENQVLVKKFFNECKQSECVISLDFHSGFGFKDRLWFPYSKTKKPFEHISEMHSFTQLFENSHPHHIYQIEPQSHGYLFHGDIWDHIFQEFIHINKNIFLPLTLEMGSWLWVKKNPLQLISKHGLFNPIKEHRIKRIFRRHHILYEFILKALYSHSAWANLDTKLRHKNYRLAMEAWYKNE